MNCNWKGIGWARPHLDWIGAHYPDNTVYPDTNHMYKWALWLDLSIIWQCQCCTSSHWVNITFEGSSDLIDQWHFVAYFCCIRDLHIATLSNTNMKGSEDLNLSLWLYHHSEHQLWNLVSQLRLFSFWFQHTNLILNLLNYLSWFIYFVEHVTSPQGYQPFLKSGLCLCQHQRQGKY